MRRGELAEKHINEGVLTIEDIIRFIISLDIHEAGIHSTGGIRHRDVEMSLQKLAWKLAGLEKFDTGDLEGGKGEREGLKVTDFEDEKAGKESHIQTESVEKEGVGGGLMQIKEEMPDSLKPYADDIIAEIEKLFREIDELSGRDREKIPSPRELIDLGLKYRVLDNYRNITSKPGNIKESQWIAKNFLYDISILRTLVEAANTGDLTPDKIKRILELEMGAGDRLSPLKSWTAGNNEFRGYVGIDRNPSLIKEAGTLAENIGLDEEIFRIKQGDPLKLDDTPSGEKYQIITHLRINASEWQTEALRCSIPLDHKKVENLFNVSRLLDDKSSRLMLDYGKIGRLFKNISRLLDEDGVYVISLDEKEIEANQALGELNRILEAAGNYIRNTSTYLYMGPYIEKVFILNQEDVKKLADEFTQTDEFYIKEETPVKAHKEEPLNDEEKEVIWVMGNAAISARVKEKQLVDLKDSPKKVINSLSKKGLIEPVGKKYRITPKGADVYDILIEEMLERIKAEQKWSNTLERRLGEEPDSEEYRRSIAKRFTLPAESTEETDSVKSGAEEGEGKPDIQRTESKGDSGNEDAKKENEDGKGGEEREKPHNVRKADVNNNLDVTGTETVDATSPRNLNRDNLMRKVEEWRNRQEEREDNGKVNEIQPPESGWTTTTPNAYPIPQRYPETVKPEIPLTEVGESSGRSNQIPPSPGNPLIPRSGSGIVDERVSSLDNRDPAYSEPGTEKIDATSGGVSDKITWARGLIKKNTGNGNGRVNTVQSTKFSGVQAESIDPTPEYSEAPTETSDSPNINWRNTDSEVNENPLNPKAIESILRDAGIALNDIIKLDPRESELTKWDITNINKFIDSTWRVITSSYTEKSGYISQTGVSPLGDDSETKQVMNSSANNGVEKTGEHPERDSDKEIEKGREKSSKAEQQDILPSEEPITVEKINEIITKQQLKATDEEIERVRKQTREMGVSDVKKGMTKELSDAKHKLMDELMREGVPLLIADRFSSRFVRTVYYADRPEPLTPSTPSIKEIARLLLCEKDILNRIGYNDDAVSFILSKASPRDIIEMLSNGVSRRAINIGMRYTDPINKAYELEGNIKLLKKKYDYVIVQQAFTAKDPSRKAEELVLEKAFELGKKHIELEGSHESIEALLVSAGLKERGLRDHLVSEFIEKGYDEKLKGFIKEAEEIKKEVKEVWSKDIWISDAGKLAIQYTKTWRQELENVKGNYDILLGKIIEEEAILEYFRGRIKELHKEILNPVVFHRLNNDILTGFKIKDVEKKIKLFAKYFNKLPKPLNEKLKGEMDGLIYQTIPDLGIEVPRLEIKNVEDYLKRIQGIYEQYLGKPIERAPALIETGDETPTRNTGGDSNKKEATQDPKNTESSTYARKADNLDTTGYSETKQSTSNPGDKEIDEIYGVYPESQPADFYNPPSGLPVNPDDLNPAMIEAGEIQANIRKSTGASPQIKENIVNLGRLNNNYFKPVLKSIDNTGEGTGNLHSQTTPQEPESKTDLGINPLILEAITDLWNAQKKLRAITSTTPAEEKTQAIEEFLKAMEKLKSYIPDIHTMEKILEAGMELLKIKSTTSAEEKRNAIKKYLEISKELKGYIPPGIWTPSTKPIELESPPHTDSAGEEPSFQDMMEELKAKDEKAFKGTMSPKEEDEEPA
ncbi:MAG: hypothetical protein U9Q22_04935 [Candidatus Altiarchaeota archaeon]|nr:hypothetical protein [Candidatus Altiarchaeota archaeon]